MCRSGGGVGRDDERENVWAGCEDKDGSFPEYNARIYSDCQNQESTHRLHKNDAQNRTRRDGACVRASSSWAT